ncbi:DUF2695 domain-containing protein [Paramicrobacterium sp. CJ85]|uniref:DUF2695 domain-containing protein n=1 Tax=Paramicrobacterium sp. CJ85 TaxID=3445355 RepID=UPI003F5DACF9
MNETAISEAEGFVARTAEALTAPRPDECLICFVYRMLEYGCDGLRWATRYRDLRVPRATRFEAGMGKRGAYCDCEILMNAVECTLWDDPELLESTPIPECRGIVRKSLQPCTLWRWS